MKGQVKLRMNDIVGNKLNCTRSIMATQKAKKVEVKTLEGVIQKVQTIPVIMYILAYCMIQSKENVITIRVQISLYCCFGGKTVRIRGKGKDHRFRLEPREMARYIFALSFLFHYLERLVSSNSPF